MMFFSQKRTFIKQNRYDYPYDVQFEIKVGKSKDAHFAYTFDKNLFEYDKRFVYCKNHNNSQKSTRFPIVTMLKIATIYKTAKI